MLSPFLLEWMIQCPAEIGKARGHPADEAGFEIADMGNHLLRRTFYLAAARQSVCVRDVVDGSTGLQGKSNKQCS